MSLAWLGWTTALREPGPRRVLGVGALADAAGSGLAAVCLPFFVVQVVGGAPALLAVAVGAFGLAEFAGAVPAGAVATKIGVQRYLVVTRALAGVAFIVVALAATPATLVVGLVFAGALTAGQAGLNQVITARVVGATERSATLAMTRSLRNIGYLSSSVLALVVLAAGSSAMLRAALVVNGLTFVFRAACYARLRLLPETPEPAVVETGSDEWGPTPDAADDSPPPTTMWVAVRDVRYMALMCVSAVFVSSMLVLDIGIPLWLDELGLPRTLAAVALGINAAAVIIAQHAVATRVAHVRTARIGLVVATTAFAVMAVALSVSAHSPLVVAGVLVLVAAAALTVGELIESPAWWTISFEVAPAQHREQYLSAFDMGAALTTLVGPTLIVLAVQAGTVGWVGLALAFILACTATLALTRRHPSLAEAPS